MAHFIYAILALCGVTIFIFGVASLSRSSERNLPAEELRKDALITLFGMIIIATAIWLY